MKFLKRLILSVSAVLIVGCSTTQQGMQRANDMYAGKSIDEFVLRFGPPLREHKLRSGNFVYQWSLGEKTYNIPSSTLASGTVTSFGYSGTSTTYGGGAIGICCDVQVLTSDDGTILSISALKDTWGAWETSRCAEIFK